MSFAAFSGELRRFMDRDVRGLGTAAFREAANLAARAVIEGNGFGPGAPLDTGFLRASFRVSRNQPEDGPTTAPAVPGRQPGDAPLYPTTADTTAIGAAQLGDTIYVTTLAEYAGYLEEGGMVRRNGPPELVGTPTEFIAPVDARWPQIVEEAVRRTGFGA